MSTPEGSTGGQESVTVQALLARLEKIVVEHAARLDAVHALAEAFAGSCGAHDMLPVAPLGDALLYLIDPEGYPEAPSPLAPPVPAVPVTAVHALAAEIENAPYDIVFTRYQCVARLRELARAAQDPPGGEGE